MEGLHDFKFMGKNMQFERDVFWRLCNSFIS